MKKLFLIISFFMCTAINAQNVDLYNNIVKELSSEKYSGRSNINGGEYSTAQYIMKEFNTLCASDFVEKPYLQSFSFPLNTMRGNMSFSVDGKNYAPTFDFVVKEFSPTSKKTLPIIYALDKKYYTKEKFCNKINSLNAENAFVVIDYQLFHTLPFDKEIYLEYLAKLKVGGVIFKYNRRPEYFKARSGYTLSFPVVCVGENFPQNAHIAHIDVESRFIKNHESNNIIAWVKGTSNSDSCYVFLAHYDHLGLMGKNILFPGANDNASGTAALLMLAHHYSQLVNRPKYSMMFLWVGGEESNLLGSIYYTEHPLYPLDKIIYLINLDMIGDTGEILYCESGKEGQKGIELFKKINADHKYFPIMEQGELVDNSDHYSFAKKGVPAMYFETKGQYYQHYHTPRDTYQHFTSDSYEKIFKMINEFINNYNK